jgi:zinc transport system substrate-binding protein
MKINKIFSLIILLVIGTLAISACSRNNNGSSNSEEKKESVFNIMVSVLPQVDFVERIGGDKVSVSEMIPPGFSPATYEPSPQQLQKLQEADIYFRIGHIPFEKAQMERLEKLNKNMKVVDTSEGIELLEMIEHSHGDEEHGDEEHGDEEYEDDHEGDDPHIWLSPKLVKIQAKNILDALVDVRAEDKEFFQANYEQFIKDLDVLDSKLKTTFAPIQGETFLVFHPAFGYLADAYGFEQEAIEIEGKDPSPEQLKAIIDEATADEIKVIFVQKQFSTESAKAVAEAISGAVVQIDPLAEDYFANLEAMSNTIVNKLQ